GRPGRRCTGWHPRPAWRSAAGRWRCAAASAGSCPWIRSGPALQLARGVADGPGDVHDLLDECTGPVGGVHRRIGDGWLARGHFDQFELAGSDQWTEAGPGKVAHAEPGDRE